LLDAEKAAQLDDDQHTVVSVSAYIGDDPSRSSMQFRLHYSDGDILWRTYCNNIANMSPLLSFAATRSEELRLTSELNKSPIQSVQTGDTCYVDLR
jgi:hypothetical protein